jgi:hypothetical protein
MKKHYVKPEVVADREIEALTGTCLPMGQNTMQDKLNADPNSGLCLNPMT